MTEAQIRLRFDAALGSEFAWRRKAEQLLKSGMVILRESQAAIPAAEALLDGTTRTVTREEAEPFEQYMRDDVGFMLIGLAIENLLKGLWVTRNAERVAAEPSWLSGSSSSRAASQ